MRDWLAQRARATPTATALVDASSGERLTYAALDSRVEELAGRLSALGIGVDDHLGVVAETGPDFVELAHASMRLGAVLVPLHARLTPAELADRADRADLSAIVCDAANEPAAVEAFDTVATVDAPTAGATPVADREPATFDVPAWDRGRPMLLLSTSGTTGDPKLVTLTSWNLLCSAAASSWRLGVLPTDRWYCVLPMSHMGGLAPVYRSMLYGTTVVTATPGSFDPERVLTEMDDHGATGVSLVPTTLRRLLDAGSLPEPLRFVLLGGAAAPESLVERAVDRDVPVCPTYGMTETASQIATARPEDAAIDPGTVGSPLMFTSVTVVDEAGAELPDGDVGELVVSGPTLTPGYYGDPEATDEAFGQHGFHTGDAGYRDDQGRIHVLNRLDDRIVTGGENVDPGEVAAVLRDCPGVEDAFVTGLTDDEFGQRVAAVVAGDVTVDSLEAEARESLAGFKLPRQWAVVDELPRTASDTVDREAARALLRDG
ncbi:class I adenylate-forming enzyme family protein [Halorarius halobius]|uniref:class I adenylate-forming enzyme family protein n=1 Tax=Halorarius halobius TaxID=2962671 RepID=UPI0020CF2086|nr:class I adenylate-forming enzyme family protein [Halorarius halobius]